MGEADESLENSPGLLITNQSQGYIMVPSTWSMSYITILYLMIKETEVMGDGLNRPSPEQSRGTRRGNHLYSSIFDLMLGKPANQTSFLIQKCDSTELERVRYRELRGSTEDSPFSDSKVGQSYD